MSRGKLYLLISAILYGVSPILATMAYRGGVNGITLTFLRSVLSVPVLYIIIRITRRSLRLDRTHIRSIVILGIFGGVLPILLLYMSYNYIPTGLATTLHFIYPIVIVIASAVLYHEKISRLTLSAVLFVTVGIFMFNDISISASKTGIILALLSGIFYSFYVIYIDHSGLDRMDYIVLTFYVMIIMSVSTLIFGLIAGTISFDISPLSWSLSAVISLIVTLGAMPLFQLGVRYEGASVSGIMSTTEPITSIVMGSLFLGEFIGTGQLMGGGMILLGVILSQRSEVKEKAA